MKEKNFKVLFLTEWFPTEKDTSYGIFIKEHAKAISLFNQVIVLTPIGSNLLELFSFKEKDDAGLRIIQINYWKSSSEILNYLQRILSFLIGILKIKKNGFQPDVIHANIFFSGVAALFGKIVFKRPIILTEHFGGLIRKDIKWYSILLAKFLIPKFDAITVVSNKLKESLEKNYNINVNPYIVPNTIDLSLFRPNKIKKFTDNKIHIAFVGRLSPVKGIHNLIKALGGVKKERDDFILHLIGGGNEKEYKKLVNQLNLNENVIFHGIKSREETANYIKKCNFLVLPSYSESFSCIILEAIACGKPIVTTNVGIISEIFNEKIGIIVKPNIKSIQKGLNEMLENYKLYDPNLISNQADSYSYQIIGEKFTSLYEKIARKKI